MDIKLSKDKNYHTTLLSYDTVSFFICGILSVTCTLNIVLNFMYFKLDTTFFAGNLYFWHCQVLLFFLSPVIAYNRYQYPKNSLLDVLFWSFCLGINVAFYFYYILFIYYGIIVFFSLLVLLTILYIAIFHSSTRRRLILLSMLNVTTFVLCQNIFKIKDIPESFKYKNVPIAVKKMFIKDIY